MHIMLALDDSAYANTIIRWMKTFPHPTGTRLSLVHVLEPLDIPEELQDRPDLRHRQEAGAKEVLSQAVRSLEKAYPDIQQIILEGFPIYELLLLIKRNPPDLIVSGTRGLRAARGLALGSVSQRLLHYAPCSVMLIPAKVRFPRRLNVILATDGSEGAKESSRFLTLLPDLGKLTVLTTMRPTDARDLKASAGAETRRAASFRTQLRQARRASAQQALDETLSVLRPFDLAPKTRIVLGHPAEAITKEAKKAHCDLLVVGSRGLTGTMAMALGSVSLAVAQSSPCPVLVVKRSV